MAPCRTPEQRVQIRRDAEAGAIKLDHVRLALRGWIQECADGVSNLGMRVAKLEDTAQEWRSRQHGINSDIYRDMHRYDDKLALASINGDDALDQRIQARAIKLERKITRLEALIENHGGGQS